ncbi:hypothetical protein CWS35_06295 [Bradyrhizobium sp. SK17]|uniref:hypothetical protein n=1 Tax=Bradyrhizobium sp. SK17 TaxID=2057741 RepID=UPI000C307F75|nr:hypothetical protein [Bradyrhizobium sp. SK17]AUC93945.1 hypothetical protein CWS35_06295 [Bradyrhizobium sp. SK17]
MTFTTDSLDDAGVLAIMVKHARAYFRRHAAEKVIEQAKAEIKEESRIIATCEASLRIFGCDIETDEAWTALMEKYRERVFEVLKLEGFVPRTATLEQAEGSTEGEAGHGLPPKPQMPTIQEILLERLQEAAADGSKAAPLRDYIQQTYNIEIHEKTVGMTLYRLLKKGLVRRLGHVWFFVPQIPADTKKPGDPPPGLLDLLK